MTFVDYSFTTISLSIYTLKSITFSIKYLFLAYTFRFNLLCYESVAFAVLLSSTLIDANDFHEARRMCVRAHVRLTARVCVRDARGVCVC